MTSVKTFCGKSTCNPQSPRQRRGKPDNGVERERELRVIAGWGDWRNSMLKKLTGLVAAAATATLLTFSVAAAQSAPPPTRTQTLQQKSTAQKTSSQAIHRMRPHHRHKMHRHHRRNRHMMHRNHGHKPVMHHRRRAM